MQMAGRRKSLNLSPYGLINVYHLLRPAHNHVSDKLWSGEVEEQVSDQIWAERQLETWRLPDQNLFLPGFTQFFSKTEVTKFVL